jgi:hypothetical protein
MAFIDTLKQRAKQHLADVQKRAQELREERARQTAIQPQPSLTYQPPQLPKFIQDLQTRIPRFTVEQPKPEPRVLTEEDRERARKVIEFGKGVLRDLPRSAASLTLKATGQKEFIPGTGVAPKFEKFLFGKEPIKTPEKTGAEFLRGLGVDEERAQGLGGVVGYPLAVLGAIPMFPGKKKIIEQLAKEGTEAGTKAILKRSVKGIAESEIDDLARRLAPISDKKVIRQELESFAKIGADTITTAKSSKLQDLKLAAYMDKARKVYEGKSPAEMVAQLSDDIAKRTNLPKDIVVKQSFFEKMAQDHPEIPQGRLFNFVKTLNIPDEIYQLPKKEKLNFFKKLEDETVNLVSTGKDFDLPQSNVITSFEINPLKKGRDKYILKIKKTGEPVYLKDSGGTPRVPSSDISKITPGEVPGTGGRSFPGPQNLIESIAEPRKVVKGPGFDFQERGFISRIKETAPELEQRVAGQYVPRSTDRLAIRAKNLIKDDIMTAEKMAREGIDDDAVAVGSELINHYNNLAAIAKTESIRAGFYDKAADIANDLAPKLTEQGRAIQAAVIYGRLTPEGILRFSARQIQKYNEDFEKLPSLVKSIKKKLGEGKVAPISGEQAKTLVEETKRVVAMPDGEAKALAFHALQDKIARLTPTPLMNKIITVWKAGLLTGLKTSGLNIMSNLFHGVAEVVKDVPASIVDSVASLFTGQRTTAFTVKGLGRGVKEGFGKGWRYFRTGLDERNVGAKLDYRKIHFGNSPIAKGFQKYEEFIFRAIGAEDQPFYYGAKARSLQSQAIAQAKNQGLRGEAARKFIDDLVANPTDEMLKNAVADAETAVFQNLTEIGKAARAIQRVGGGAGEIVVPFGRTPSSVAMQILNYSPVGIARALGTAILHYKDFAAVQRQFSMIMGRGITGTAILGLGAWLFTKDRIALGYPTDERERKQWELEGKIPNAIKIGDKWRQAIAFGPPGLMLMWGGYMRQAYEETGSQNAAANATEMFLRSLSGMGKTFTEQTFVRGIDSALGLLTDPEVNWERAIRTLPIGPSAVPTIISDIARATDPYQRATGRGLKGIYPEGLMARIPGLRERLQPRIDVAGEVVERPGSPIETMIDPTRPSEIKISPAIAELARLSTADHRVTPTDIEGKYGYKSLTPEQNTLLKQKAGQRLFKSLGILFASEEYREMDDEDKAKAIQRFVEKARRNARAELLKEILYSPDGPKGEALTAKIKELKDDKVLTQEVRKKLLELLEEEEE